MSDLILKSYKLHDPGVLTLTTDVLDLYSKVYSCGVDDSVGAWKYLEESNELEYDVHNCMNKCHGAVAVVGSEIYVAETAQNPTTKQEQQVIVKYKIGAFDSSPPLLTFSLEVTSLSVSRDSQHLIGGSNDFTVKCFHLNDKSYDRYECDAPIVHVSFDPKNVFFSVSMSNGYVQFRTVEKSTNKAPIAQFKACSAFSLISPKTSRMQVSWSSSGSRVFVPSTGGVLVVDCMKWTEERMLNLPEANREVFSVSAISANDQYFAACSLQGTLIVWHIDGADETISLHSSMDVKASPSFITSLVFDPSNRESLLMAYSSGHLGMIRDVSKRQANGGDDDAKVPSQSLSRSDFHHEKSNKRRSRVIFDDDEEENTLFSTKSDSRQPHDDGVDRSLSSASNSNATAASGAKNDGGDEQRMLVDDNENDAEVDLGAIKSSYGFNSDGLFVGGPAKQQSLSAGASAGGSFDIMKSTAVAATGLPAVNREQCTTVKQMRMRKSFVSGATPFNQNQRYLMWNTFGTIKSFRTSEESTIEITFHDATVHSEIVIDNTKENYILGDMNYSLVALASHGYDREGRLWVRHIDSWDADSREWIVPMPSAEDVDFLSVGADYVAVFTTSRFLRIFTASGVQRFVTSLSGPITTMTAYGSLLAIVRPTGGVIITSEDEYEHQLTASLYEVQPLTPFRSVHILRRIDVCVGNSATARLEWIGFTNRSRLVTMDGECTVRLYCDVTDSWVPIFVGASTLKDDESDFLWPIAVLERPSPTFRYVYCRHAKYPSVGKNAIPITVPWSIPLLDATSERSNLEGQLLLNELLQLSNHSTISEHLTTQEVDHLTKSFTASLIKLFALSFNVSREYRAVELAHLALNAQGIQLMCNYLAKRERPNLSEKIAAIGRQQSFNHETVVATSSSRPYERQHSEDNSPNQISNEGGDSISLAPSAIRVQKRQQKTFSSQSLNRFISTADDDTAFPSSRSGFSTLDTIDSTLLSMNRHDRVEESQVSTLSDVYESESALAAKNPLKRTQPESQDDDLFNVDGDFFDQLAKKKFKSDDAASVPSASTRSTKNGSRNARQAKLSFGSAESKKRPLVDMTNNDEKSVTRRSGFDLWSEKNKSEILKTYDGDTASFNMFLIQKFRGLDAQEKKQWNDEAKAL